MTQFHEGQDVEVRMRTSPRGYQVDWRKARIVSVHAGNGFETDIVEFPNGVQLAYDSASIRAVKTSTMTADDNGRIYV